MTSPPDNEEPGSGDEARSRLTDRRSDFLSRFLAIEANLYRYVCAVAPMPQDARDIVQETALALWEHDDRYDPDRPFLPWVLSVARNKARQHAEKTGRFPFLLGDEKLLETIAKEQEEDTTSATARRAHLKGCLEKLRPEHVELIRGYYWDRIPIDDLSAMMNSTADAVYKRLQRIRGSLLDCIRRLEQREASS